MLFPYTYVPNQMERMQRFVNFIFYQVWCCAPKSGSYNINLFDKNPPLKEVLTAFAYSHTEEGDKFASRIEAIYHSFSQLDRSDIVQLKRWYQGNNNLQEVCSNNPTIRLARYTDIEMIDNDLANKLALFFKNLYSRSLLKLSALRTKIGDFDDHYQKFVKVNNSNKCPFCGLDDLFGEYHSKREAYDHYLPKSIYPFNSINLKNLVPACHHCNSSYKTSKDPAYKPKDPAYKVKDPAIGDQRRAFFYPYTETQYTIELELSFEHPDVDNLETKDINIHFGPPELSEELETWKEVYGIEERYKAKTLGEQDGKYWLLQIREEWSEDGRLPADYLSTLARQTRKHPYAECNFLKKPFLDACQQIGLFDDINIEQTNDL